MKNAFFHYAARFMMIVAVAALVAAGLVPAAEAEIDPSAYSYNPCSGNVTIKLKQKDSSLNVRPGPGKVGEPLFPLKHGQTMQVDGWQYDVTASNSTQHWFRLVNSAGSVLGWVSGEFCDASKVKFSGAVPQKLRNSSGGSASVKPDAFNYTPCEGWITVDTQKDPLTIRNAPYQDAKALGKLAKGEKAMVDGWAYDAKRGAPAYWFRVVDNMGKLRGWINSDYCLIGSVDFGGDSPF